MRIIIISILVSGLGFSQGFLHNLNGEVVDGDGQPILLRGFGLGGWLVPEGYMLHNQAWIQGFESPTDIENHVLELIGPDEANNFWELYRANYVAQADIDKIAEWGFNHIRVPFHYKQFYDSTGTETPIGYAIIDELITWCQPHNIYIILDMHCAPGAQNGGPISDSDGIARLWLEDSYKELTIQIWKEIATYYADHTLIAGYDLINEPVLPSGVSLEEFKQLYVDITEAIREVDNNHLIWIEGNWYGTDFAGLTPPWDDNMGYSFHKYWGQTDITTIQSYINMRNNYGVPLWMGVIASLTDPEYGEISKPYTTHSIPGTIPAAYYDIGARGLSYSDSDYWNDGDGGYNDGWVFRNGGVDVEGSDDDPNIPYTVGWTEAGEWLGYTIEDVSPGTYEVSFSISAPDAGGIFFAQLSGQNLGVIDVPATGGWYNWEDLPAQTITVSEGEKFLKIQIVQAGFNIQSVNFNQVLSIDNSFLNPDDFMLGKPYPNPFNPSVKLNLAIKNPGEFQIKVYNLKGELIRNWNKTFIQKGNHFIHWNALDNHGVNVPSGIFFITVNDHKDNKREKVILLR